MDKAKQFENVLALKKKMWTCDEKTYVEHVEKMLTILHEILAADKKNCTALINLGAINCHLGNYEKAKSLLLEVKSLNSEDKNLFLNLGYVSIYLTEPQEIYSEYLEIAKTKKSGVCTFEAYFDGLAH